ncbi:hypothetical protein OEA41_007211 [Lepraria neglecta]|uniref:Uncharacterized protein n=1 Tax=Lepraria neglecta TaxID=209136 RepID=A0AAE0DMU5_9LECA|nr:hypothetical protein OEA41_007211 [Lepraria neglecta]
MTSQTSARASPECEHNILRFESSTHAEEVGYRRPAAQQRAIAAGRTKKDADSWSDSSFPAPLVLPGDELSFDPRYPPQSLRSWLREKERNEVTKEKNALYVAGPPDTDTEIGFVRTWACPEADAKGVSVNATARPSHVAVANYLGAFYHGMRVKLLPSETLRFTSWIDDGSQPSKSRAESTKPKLIGLTTPKECIGIRTRVCPDKTFQRQLNLDDLLDVAISVLPDDAYALLMVVEHDLFEDEDDDFCCGRAYGGSRIAAVSMARYNPTLDEQQNVGREHAWPASHCDAYVQECCGATPRATKKARTRSNEPTTGPEELFQAAVSAHKPFFAPTSLSTNEQLSPSGLWLSRVCQTASHELGHCFGMDHCVYYACVMQGTASLAEDVRQPPYLCPVDLAKVLRATGAGERGRYEAILAFCEGHEGTPMFAVLGAWIRGILAESGPQGQSSTQGSKMGFRNMPVELSP